MKKMEREKRLFIAAMVLSLAVTGCGASQEISDGGQKENFVHENGSDTEQVVQHLLEVWSDYLQALDHMYASELWAMDYVDTYLKSGSWEDLRKARTACIVSAGYLTELAMPEEDLKEEEYLVLADAGIDTGYQTMEFYYAADKLDEAHRVIRDRLLEGLECDMFYESSMEILRKEMEIQRELISCMRQDACIMTNYLLLTVKEYADVQEWWGMIQEEYSALSAECPEWMGTEAETMKAEDQCMDEYEAISLKYSELLSRMKAELYEWEQIAQKGTVKELEASAFRILNTPDFLPMPEWYDPTEAEYASFNQERDGNLIYPESGDELESDGAGVYVQMEGISREEAAAYIEMIEIYADAIKDEDSNWYISMPDYKVKVEWKEQIVTMIFYGEDVTFAPEWYIYM